MKIIIAALIAITFSSQIAYAESFTDQQAIKAILGESRQGNNYQAMLAIAHAIRNRQSLHGVYGLRSNMEPIEQQTNELAVNAWYESEHGLDITHGATHWLSDDDIKHGRKALTEFRFKMVETLYISHTHFYKEQ